MNTWYQFLNCAIYLAARYIQFLFRRSFIHNIVRLILLNRSRASGTRQRDKVERYRDGIHKTFLMLHDMDIAIKIADICTVHDLSLKTAFTSPSHNKFFCRLH
jgi:hypothetical protein